MIGISFQVDDSELQIMADAVEEELPLALLAAAEEEADIVNEKIRDHEPHGTGVLQAVTGRFNESFLEPGTRADENDAVFWVGQIAPGEYGAIVGTNLSYAKYVNDGYTAGDRQFAKFREDGERVFRRLIPGTYYEGLFFFEKGAEEAAIEYKRVMMGAISNAIINVASKVRVTRGGQVRAYTKRGIQRKIRIRR